MLSGKQKRLLRSKAMTQRALINLGKGGLTHNFVQGVYDALDAREMIKIALLPAAAETPKEVGAYLHAEIPELEVAQTIGRSLVVYMPSTKEDKQKLSKQVAALAK
ncbi:YhbY family RNA-binding protein [Lacticaseibacillus songhuajiangensis]|jgi:RNA-binding protein|uniref:YhbY family RNA-binding protein n=1 Tax=Lacticaseibacillus songhuajiangensis TaxID=1296539 RepID=UPI000F774CB5|nr:YhbY family RNA-binding protein [Lacticaseibacillus songhuajiangensis]MCI1284075.1 YhbY family RNA-binding protein [Lacticaseibacillus songhuajiangensis]